LALPHLLKPIYTLGTDETIRRGKKIHAIGYAELADYDDLFGTAVFRVKDDNYATSYKVHIQQFKDPSTTSLRCTCPYNIGDICRHEVAALLQLQELLDRGQLRTGHASFDQRHTVAKMKQIELKTLRMLCGPEVFSAAENFLRTQKAQIEFAENEMIKARVVIDGQSYLVMIRKNEERYFDTSCDYIDEKHALCLPKVIVFLQLLHMHGTNYFDSIRNWDKEKNKLLEAYGYSLKDDLTDKFEFTYKEGKPFLRVLDPSIKRVAPVAAVPRTSVLQPKPMMPSPVIEAETSKPALLHARRIGVVFAFNKKTYPYFTVEVVLGEPNDSSDGFAGKVEKLDITRHVSGVDISERDQELIGLLRKMQAAEINKYVSRNSPFSGIWENIVQQEDEDLPEDTRDLITEYLLPKLKKLFSELYAGWAYCLPPGKSFTTAHLQPLQLETQSAQLLLSVKKNGQYQVSARMKAGATELSISEQEYDTPLFFVYNHQAWLWPDKDRIRMVERFRSNGKQTVTVAAWPDYLKNELVPLARQYAIQFDKGIMQAVKDESPVLSLYLAERNDYLIFQPRFSYLGYEVTPNDRDELIVPQGEKVLVIQRRRDKEEIFIDRMRALHSGFVYEESTQTLALKGTEILKNNWFFLFVDAMKELKTPVYGFESLRSFRFNTAKPQTRVFISSHTDWFDAKVDILYGDQRVTVAEVKRALANNQSFVQLDDGTLGILPEEWLKKYALLFRVGEGKNDQLRLSKYHMTVLDELYAQRDDSQQEIELEEKYERIREQHQIASVEPSETLMPILRPYQVSGFQWLNYLKDVGWGGILADDMGLGKTVQALSMLEHFRRHEGKLKALVVCPTTLIYNWENEIRKFTPALTYRIHHGANRIRTAEALAEPEVTITTYGTLRSDIKLLSALQLDYVLLDESQAIKNPASKVTRAAGLLQAKHRVCMSGTPLQNNTFDIYAQMQFLNPGMLGTMEFFKQEFAIPIDKLGEVDRKEHLRKLLYPFILRRTKEQVAKDLPEKQEMILYCEMEEEQRSIYDAYRNDYRNQILGSIETQGIQKSQLTILQGLMKLRQICDSPAILNEKDKFENHSIKLEELARELMEGIGTHKALVFSQFLGMLGLIRDRLTELNIPYEYFDGSTSAPDREKAIRRFQDDDSVRVFLISLKAGGVGLNLTAADYVYIVDPWWNPAVEQQAIDRTHRIGQTKNIFAYRMICKDTIEDKILQLQEKKRALARDIVSDETGFVKSLSREDVEYLFS
jgi:superfamily II DNA or RNA helicase